METDDNLAKIILGVISLLVVIASGALITIRKSKSKRNNQIGNTIIGDKNRITGGDDNSVNL